MHSGGVGVQVVAGGAGKVDVAGTGGTISAVTSGVNVQALGGAITVGKAGGVFTDAINVTGAGAVGILATSTDNGAVTINTSGAINSSGGGADYGVDVNVSGKSTTANAVSVTVGVIGNTGAPATGVEADITSNKDSGTLTVQANGNITADTLGIHAGSAGAGAVSVTAANGIEIKAGSQGIVANGVGATSVTLGTGVTIDPAISAIDSESTTDDATATLADSDTITVVNDGTGATVAGIIVKSGGTGKTAAIVGSTKDVISVTDDGSAGPAVTGIEAIGTGTNTKASITGFSNTPATKSTPSPSPPAATTRARATPA